MKKYFSPLGGVIALFGRWAPLTANRKPRNMTLRMRTTSHRVGLGCKWKLSPCLLFWHRPWLDSTRVARTITNQRTPKIPLFRLFTGNGSTIVSQVRLYFQIIAYLPEFQKNINTMGLSGRVQLLHPVKHDVPNKVPMTKSSSMAILELSANDEDFVIGT